MSQLLSFVKKELMETWRTRKLLILFILFLIFGVMSPFVAKITPEILKMNFGSMIPTSTPTSVDSWEQFYKNIHQMGIYLFIILFSGIVSQEVAKGTLVNLVTKGLHRHVVILSKGIVLYLQWFLAVTCSFLVAFGYTSYYFKDEKSPNVFSAFVLLLVFGLFLTGLILVTSAIARNQFEGLLLAIFGVILLYIIRIFPHTETYDPLSLITQNLAVLQGKSTITELVPSMLITVVLSILLTFGGVQVLNKKKL